MSVDVFCCSINIKIKKFDLSIYNKEIVYIVIELATVSFKVFTII